MTIEFISHEYFPEDQYTKELVYLCLDGKYRIAYVRKDASNGGKFWSVVSGSATKNGKKEYFPGFIQDSNFVEKDIKDFLEKRSWEKKSVYQSQKETYHQDPLPRATREVQDDMPF